jgi:hypothetical protein
VIDVESGSLQNVVEFGQQVPAESALVVDSDVQVVSEQRCQFKFRSLHQHNDRTRLLSRSIGCWSSGWPQGLAP